MASLTVVEPTAKRKMGSRVSGENPGRVCSGRDEEGAPKDLGIVMQQSLFETIEMARALA